ncbi:hypothetical protein PCE1_001369 [Barthelona sp. PCE]
MKRKIESAGWFSNQYKPFKPLGGDLQQIPEIETRRSSKYRRKSNKNEFLETSLRQRDIFFENANHNIKHRLSDVARRDENDSVDGTHEGELDAKKKAVAAEKNRILSEIELPQPHDINSSSNYMFMDLKSFSLLKKELRKSEVRKKKAKAGQIQSEVFVQQHRLGYNADTKAATFEINSSLQNDNLVHINAKLPPLNLKSGSQTARERRQKTEVESEVEKMVFLRPMTARADSAFGFTMAREEAPLIPSIADLQTHRLKYRRRAFEDDIDSLDRKLRLDILQKISERPCFFDSASKAIYSVERIFPVNSHQYSESDRRRYIRFNIQRDLLEDKLKLLDEHKWLSRLEALIDSVETPHLYHLKAALNSITHLISTRCHLNLVSLLKCFSSLTPAAKQIKQVRQIIQFVLDTLSLEISLNTFFAYLFSKVPLRLPDIHTSIIGK